MSEGLENDVRKLRERNGALEEQIANQTYMIKRMQKLVDESAERFKAVTAERDELEIVLDETRRHVLILIEALGSAQAASGG